MVQVLAEYHQAPRRALFSFNFFEIKGIIPSRIVYSINQGFVRPKS